jgi:soluble lytic murein transglycosylase
VRLGTLYFQRLVKQFGGAHYALASYNAGENRVGRWINERPPLPQDEFIDDIPYPETQNYVKRILGTAEDYRRLYGGGVLTPVNSPGSLATPLVLPVKPDPPRAAPRRPAAPTRKPLPRRRTD